MKQVKRILAFLITVCMVVTMLPEFAHADEPAPMPTSDTYTLYYGRWSDQNNVTGGSVKVNNAYIAPDTHNIPFTAGDKLTFEAEAPGNRTEDDLYVQIMVSPKTGASYEVNSWDAGSDINVTDISAGKYSFEYIPDSTVDFFSVQIWWSEYDWAGWDLESEVCFDLTQAGVSINLVVDPEDAAQLLSDGYPKVYDCASTGDVKLIYPIAYKNATWEIVPETGLTIRDVYVGEGSKYDKIELPELSADDTYQFTASNDYYEAGNLMAIRVWADSGEGGDGPYIPGEDCYAVEYSPFEWDENVDGEIEHRVEGYIYVGSGTVSRGVEYNFSDGNEMTFKIESPSSRKEDTPIVDIEIFNIDGSVTINSSRTNEVGKTLSVDKNEDGDYIFKYTPDAEVKSFVVRVWWSAFDAFEYNGQTEICLNTTPNGCDFNFGEELEETEYPKMIECQTTHEKKYVVPNSYIGETIELVPGEGVTVNEVQIGEKNRETLSAEDMISEGKYLIKLDSKYFVDGRGNSTDWTQINVGTQGGEGGDGPYIPNESCYAVEYDSFEWDDVVDGEIDHHVEGFLYDASTDGVLSRDTEYGFEENGTLIFDIESPSTRKDDTPVVDIEIFNKDGDGTWLSSRTEEEDHILILDTISDGYYNFIYTPGEEVKSFVIRLWWSAFDAFEYDGETEICLNTSPNGCDFNFGEELEGTEYPKMIECQTTHAKKYVIPNSYIDETIELVPGEGVTVTEVEIGEKNRDTLSAGDILYEGKYLIYLDSKYFVDGDGKPTDWAQITVITPGGEGGEFIPDAGYYAVEYSPLRWTDDNDVYHAEGFIKVNGDEISNGSEEGTIVKQFDEDDELIFTIISPESRIKDNPYVYIDIYNKYGSESRLYSDVESGDPCYIGVQKAKNGEYSFKYTPDSDVKSFVVKVYWSYYDLLNNNEDEVYMDLSIEGADAFLTFPEGILSDEDSERYPYIAECETTGERRYVYSESVKLCTVHIGVDDGKTLDEFRVGSNRVLDPEDYKVSDGEYEITLTEDMYEDNRNCGRADYVWLTARAHGQDDGPCEFIPDSGKFAAEYDRWENTGSDKAVIKVGNNVIDPAPEEVEFTAGQKITFDIYSPDSRKDDVPVIAIKEFDAEESGSWRYVGDAYDDGISITTKSTGQYSFDYTPAEDVDSFVIYLYWSEYDYLSADDGEICIDITVSEGVNIELFDDLLTDEEKEEGYPKTVTCNTTGEKRYIYPDRVRNKKITITAEEGIHIREIGTGNNKTYNLDDLSVEGSTSTYELTLADNMYEDWGNGVRKYIWIHAFSQEGGEVMPDQPSEDEIYLLFKIYTDAENPSGPNGIENSETARIPVSDDDNEAPVSVNIKSALDQRGIESGDKFYVTIEQEMRFTDAAARRFTSIKIGDVYKDIQKAFGRNTYEITYEGGDLLVDVGSYLTHTYNIMWANDGADVAGTDYDNPETKIVNGSAYVYKVYNNAEDMTDISSLIEGTEVEGCVGDNGLGYIVLEEGNIAEFKFVPKYGHQLIAIAGNGQPSDDDAVEITAQTETNIYRFEMPSTNVHFYAEFAEVDDEVKTSATDVKTSGNSIVLADNEISEGTVQLNVSDASLTQAQKNKFANEVSSDNYEVSSELAIDLNQVFYKGTDDSSDVWAKPIGHDEKLKDKATITLSLNYEVEAGKVKILHELEDGTVETIDATVNEDKTVSFETDSFSNYAICTPAPVTDIVNTNVKRTIKGKTVTLSPADGTEDLVLRKMTTPDNAHYFRTHGYLDGTTGIENVIIEGFKEIEGYAFAFFDYHTEYDVYAGLKTITIGESVTKIESWAFSDVPAESIILKEGLITIEKGSFYNCRKLKSITIPKTVENIGKQAFKNDSSLESVVLCQGLKTIDSEAFAGCYSLKELIIPDSVKNIGDRILLGDKNLKKLVYPKEVDSIGNLMIIESSNDSDQNNVLESLVLPIGTITIGNDAFRGLKALSSITIPETVTTIGWTPFDDCKSLKEITLPLSAVNIDIDAFLRSNLTKVKLNSKFKNTQFYLEDDQNIEFIYYSDCKHAGQKNKINSSEYLKSEATCTSPALYYYECAECYNMTEETYEVGKALGHSKVKTVTLAYLKSKATCQSPAIYYYDCSTCHNKLEETYENGTAAGHTEDTDITPATTKKDGSIVKKCSVCNEVLDTKVIAKAFVTVEETAKYTGKAIKQPVKVTDAEGKAISKSFYSVAYKNNIKEGKASVTIKFTGNYKGTVIKNFTIVKKDIIPAKVSGLKLTAGKKAFTVGWKTAKNADGYEIQYSTDKKFLTGVKTVKITKADTTKKAISKLKAKTAYYVRIRAYNKEGKTTAYSAWSSSKSVKTK